MGNIVHEVYCAQMTYFDYKHSRILFLPLFLFIYPRCTIKLHFKELSSILTTYCCGGLPTEHSQPVLVFY